MLLNTDLKHSHDSFLVFSLIDGFHAACSNALGLDGYVTSGHLFEGLLSPFLDHIAKCMIRDRGFALHPLVGDRAGGVSPEPFFDRPFLVRVAIRAAVRVAHDFMCDWASE